MASALDTVRAGIEAALVDCVEDDLDLEAAVISWPGADFTPPTSAPWVRADVLWGEGDMNTGGSGVAGNAITGVFKVKLYDVPGTGLGTLYDRADLVRTAFSRRTIGTAYFFAPSGPRDASEEAWAGVVVDCPFRVREA